MKRLTLEFECGEVLAFEAIAADQAPDLLRDWWERVDKHNHLLVRGAQALEEVLKATLANDPAKAKLQAEATTRARNEVVQSQRVRAKIRAELPSLAWFFCTATKRFPDRECFARFLDEQATAQEKELLATLVPQLCPVSSQVREANRFRDIVGEDLAEDE